MEQYFEITSQSSRYKEYFDYLEADEACRKAVKKFIEENNIHTEHYAVFGGALWIDNNQENREKYGNQLKKDGDDGLAAFKKTSKIGRAWTGLGIKEVHKPHVSFFFVDPSYSSRTRLFHVGEKLYCSIDCMNRSTKVKTPQGFIEMKASEFFKIIEDVENDDED